MTEGPSDQEAPSTLPDLGAVYGASGSPLDDDQYKETPDDTGNAYRFKRLVGSTVRYLASEQTWLVWDGKRLKRDDARYAFHAAEKVVLDVREHSYHVVEEARKKWDAWATQTASASRREALLKISSAMPDMQARPDELDANEYLLNTPSGVVDLRDGSVRPCQIEDKITRLTRVEYQSDVEWSDPLVKYHLTFMPDPTEWNYLMKFLGSMLLAHNRFRVWAMIYGPTTTGKSQLVETIATILGDYAVSVNSSVFRSNLDDKPRPDLIRALTARLVYAMEASENWELHADQVKRMTGEEKLVARGMRSDIMVERIPDFTPLIVCNTIPRLKGSADTGVRRRLRILPFTYSKVADEDPAERQKFANDHRTQCALLTQLVRGAARSMIEGIDQDIPPRFMEHTLESFSDLSHTGEFVRWLEDSGTLLYDSTYTGHRCWKSEDLYSRYTFWVQIYGSGEDKRSMLSMRSFNAELRGMGWQTMHSNGTRWVGKVNNALSEVDQ